MWKEDERETDADRGESNDDRFVRDLQLLACRNLHYSHDCKCAAARAYPLSRNTDIFMAGAGRSSRESRLEPRPEIDELKYGCVIRVENATGDDSETSLTDRTSASSSTQRTMSEIECPERINKYVTYCKNAFAIGNIYEGKLFNGERIG